MIETRQIRSGNSVYVNDLTAFGWQIAEKVSRRRGRKHYSYQVLARDTDMPDYDRLKKLEDDYENARSKLQTYYPPDGLTVLLLLLLFVVTGIIYIIHKYDQKTAVEENNQKRRQQMQECVKEALEMQECVKEALEIKK